MKVIVKTVFFDETGLHKVGDIVEVKAFDERRMELIEEDKKPVKKATKK